MKTKRRVSNSNVSVASSLQMLRLSYKIADENKMKYVNIV